MEETGIRIGEMQKRMMEKIEELTLYTIQQEKRLEIQSRKIERLQSMVTEAP